MGMVTRKGTVVVNLQKAMRENIKVFSVNKK